MIKKVLLALSGLLALASCAPLPASAASCTPGTGVSCYGLKDSAGSAQSVRALVLGDGTIVQMTIPTDATGNAYTALNPLPVGFSALPALASGTNVIGDVRNITGTIPLAANAATSAKQDTANSTLQSLLTALGTPLQTGGHVVIDSQPLPTGAATDAKSEAIRALLAAQLTVGLPAGAATDAKSEAIRALLAGTLTTSLPSNAATATAQASGNASVASIDTKTPTLGQKTSAFSVPVVLPSDQPLTTAAAASELHLGEIGGNSALIAATFSRPANTTAYAARVGNTAGSLVANSTTAGSVTPMQLVIARKVGGTGTITAVKLAKSSPIITNASFRVHFYGTAPTASNGDGSSWLTTPSSYLGYADIAMDKVFTTEASGSALPKTSASDPRAIVFSAAAGSQTIYALVEALGNYTPVSGETFVLTVDVSRD